MNIIRAHWWIGDVSRYFWYTSADFLQTFVATVPWGKDELITIWVMVKGQRYRAEALQS